MPFFESKAAFLAEGLVPLTAQEKEQLADDFCCICGEQYGDKDDNRSTDGASEMPVRLPCTHVMGRNCILQWTNAARTCPFCRQSLFPGAAFTDYEPLALDFGGWSFDSFSDTIPDLLIGADDADITEFTFGDVPVEVLETLEVGPELLEYCLSDDEHAGTEASEMGSGDVEAPGFAATPGDDAAESIASDSEESSRS